MTTLLRIIPYGYVLTVCLAPIIWNEPQEYLHVERVTVIDPYCLKKNRQCHSYITYERIHR